MALVAAKCTQCGANINVDDTRDAGICEFCGTPFVTEKVINNNYTVNVNNFAGANVTIDNSIDLAKSYEAARRFRKDCNFSEALRYYDMILQEDPSSWEAYFYCNYFRKFPASKADVEESAAGTVLILRTALDMIESSEMGEEQRLAAIREVADSCLKLADTLHTKLLTVEQGDVEIPITQMGSHLKDVARITLYIASIGYMVGDMTEQKFPWVASKDSSILVRGWKQGVEFHQDCASLLPNKAEGQAIIDDYVSKIRKYEPGYVVEKLSEGSSSSGGGCYVATCVYGSYDCPQVWTLRRFRDYDLAETWHGRLFIKLYYAVSPTLVRLFGETAWFKRMWRGSLDSLVSRCQSKGYSDAPYQDRVW